MNDDYHSSNGSGQRSWIDRLATVFSMEPRDREQLLELLRVCQKKGLMDVDAQGMIEGVLQVAEMQVRDVMIPRAQVVVLDRDLPVEEMLNVVADSGHSRFPVIGDSRDEVVGILLAKDMLRYFIASGKKNFNVRDLLRPAVFIPESKRLNVLLKEFRASRNHLAMVVDEYGGVAGLVTIEDVLEQIVGEITDEHDVEEGAFILEHGEGRSTVKALTPIEEFNTHFGSELSDEEFDTIGGWLLHEFGHLPKQGEKIAASGFQFKVLRADIRRIHLIQVTRQ